LLFETGFQRYFDGTIGVATDPEVLRQRLKRSGRLSLKDVARRLKVQLPAATKIGRCDFVIDNSSSKARTHRQVKKLMEDSPWRNWK